MLQPRATRIDESVPSVGMAVVKDANLHAEVGLAGPLQLSSCLSSDDIDLNDIAGMGQNHEVGISISLTLAFMFYKR